MTTLKNQELLDINGGALSIAHIGVGLVALGVFIASVIYGYVNPNKCNN